MNILSEIPEDHLVDFVCEDGISLKRNFEIGFYLHHHKFSTYKMTLFVDEVSEDGEEERIWLEGDIFLVVGNTFLKNCEDAVSVKSFSDRLINGDAFESIWGDVLSIWVTREKSLKLIFYKDEEVFSLLIEFKDQVFSISAEPLRHFFFC